MEVREMGLSPAEHASKALLAFLSRNREFLQQPEQDLEDLQAEQEEPS